MVSSEVELISSSSSPFGSVFKDHNHRERQREPSSKLAQKSQTNFQRNLKMLVKDHFHSFISISGRGSSIEANENSCLQSTGFGCWGSKSNNHNHCKDVNMDKDLSNISIEKYNEETSSSSMIEKQKSQILNLGFVQQEQDMVATTETQIREKEHTSLSECHSISSKTSNSIRGPSPSLSTCSSTDLSVSSLVQIWRGFESEAKNNQCSKNNGNMEVQNSLPNSIVFSESNKVSSNSSTYDPTIKTLNNYMQECATDLNSFQCTSRHEEQKQHHDISYLRGEKEGINVADMVKAWANTYQVTCDQSYQEKQSTFHEGLTKLRVGLDKREQCLISSPVIHSSKLKGRQAITDLFMRMERERYKEVESLISRQAVTRFPQRGRIQALLRLRILQREASIQEKQGISLIESTSRGSNQSQITATIHNIRERCVTSNQNIIGEKNTHTKSTISIQEAKNSIASKQTSEQTRHQEKCNVDNSLTNITECYQDRRMSLTSNQVLFEENTNTHCKNDSMQLELDLIEQDQVVITSTLEQQNDSFSVHRQETSYEDDANLNGQDITSTTNSCANWEEENDIIDDHDLESNHQHFGANIDWIIDISRPRDYWEDCRQARYREILNTQPKDKDIRQLIERGNVSSILASDFRARMDRLMMCSIQRLNHYNNEDKQTSLLNNCLESGQDNQENIQVTSQEFLYYGEENEVEILDGALNTTFQQYHDVSDYDQTPLFSSQQPSPNHSYHTNEGSSLKNISTIDVELICDLRIHMQQLHQEMFELRKSITSCMDMQVKLQNSIQEEVSIAISRIADEGKQKNSSGRHLKMGCCHICYDKKIDSLLYRCGHMCTCFDCADELRWSSKKCPICRAQIIDVVRTYCDT